jgi:F-type H+-transporting ATPase subunit delta
LSTTSIARRYALGLIKSIEDEKEYRKISKDLQQFQTLLQMNGDLQVGMTTMLFSKDQKRDILDTIHRQARLHAKTFNFLATVIEENRLVYLEEMIALLEDLWFEENNIQKLKVFSAVKLDKPLEERLNRKMEKAFGKKVVLETTIDKSLIAGLKIQKGSIFYDFSIAGNLRKLKEALVEEN